MKYIHTSEKPMVSVVMSVYNGEKYLRPAIESVLNQSFWDFEFIIVDDGSTDMSREIIEEYRLQDRRIKCVKQENSGLSKALNVGVGVATCEYIARMDADDICDAERLAIQFRFLEENELCVVVGTNANYIDMSGSFLYRSKCLLDNISIRKALPQSPFFHSATMFRKSVFLQAGGYFEEAPHFFEDKILWNRMARFGELANIDSPLLSYRIVPTSITAHKFAVSDLDSICERIIATGTISPDDKLIVQSLRKKRIASSLLMSNYFLKIGKIYLEYNFIRSRAALNLLKSIKYYPFQYKAWINLAFVFLPMKIVHRWKTSRGVYKSVW